MASERSKYLLGSYASIKERVSKPDMDLTMIRVVVENLHLAAIEPEGLTYAEVDADGVPARRSIHPYIQTPHIGDVVCTMPVACLPGFAHVLSGISPAGSDGLLIVIFQLGMIIIDAEY